MNGGEQTVPTDWTPISTTEEEENEDDNLSCNTDGVCAVNGANPDPTDCSRYYLCTCGADDQWLKTLQTCPDGLWFNPEFLYCDYPENVDCTPSFYLSFQKSNENDTIIVEGNNAVMSAPNILILYLCFILVCV